MIEIIDHKKFVLENQPIQQFIVDRLPGHHDLYFNTLDKALQRFNTILLRLSQEPLLAQELNADVIYCQKAIHDFYKYSRKLTDSHNWFSKLYYRTCLHGIGINRIPKIKKLLNALDN